MLTLLFVVTEICESWLKRCVVYRWTGEDAQLTLERTAESMAGSWTSCYKTASNRWIDTTPECDSAGHRKENEVVEALFKPRSYYWTDGNSRSGEELRWMISNRHRKYPFVSLRQTVNRQWPCEDISSRLRALRFLITLSYAFPPQWKNGVSTATVGNDYCRIIAVDNTNEHLRQTTSWLVKILLEEYAMIVNCNWYDWCTPVYIRKWQYFLADYRQMTFSGNDDVYSGGEKLPGNVLRR